MSPNFLLISSNPHLSHTCIFSAHIPQEKPGSTKYGPSGLFTPESFTTFTTNPELAQSLSNLANHSLTKKTWSSYATAGRMLKTCCSESNLPLTYPLSDSTILSFIAWLNNRGLKASTINSYLAGIRQIHLTLGLTPPMIRSELVNQLLSGKKKLDFCSNNSTPTRLPITPNLLRLTKVAISKDSLNKVDMRSFWFLCTLGFFGSFRMGELLGSSTKTFDPNFTLLKKDIILNSTVINNKKLSFLEIRLKSSKCSPTNSTLVDIYPTNNDICPVKAFIKWNKSSIVLPNSPAFQLSSGLLITKELFNKKLHIWLSDYIDPTIGVITGHSFRAGLVSILSSAGFQDSDLKSIGRWSSRAFLLYTKLPRTKRLAMAQALGNMNL